MADRGLTAREFWRLSPTERMKRCGELSDHEAFVARLTDPTPPISPPCNRCKYYLGYAKCIAYPDGMSAEHINAVIADLTIMCGNGFRFTQRDES